MNEIISPVLAKLVRRIDIDGDEIEVAFGEILSGRASDIEAAGFAVALRTKGETTTELAAMVRTMLRFAGTVTVAAGAIDTCGTGGDRAGTVNVSTIAAIVAAGAGARVVKHGNRAASSQCGSADVLEALGIPIELGPAGVEACVAEVGIGFCLAQRYHPALRFMGPARRELGVPTTFNFLGPLANPARVRRQAVGVADPAMAERVIAVLQANGAEHAWVFHGDDGLDELTTTTTSTVYELRDGAIRRRRRVGQRRRGALGARRQARASARRRTRERGCRARRRRPRRRLRRRPRSRARGARQRRGGARARRLAPRRRAGATGRGELSARGVAMP